MENKWKVFHDPGHKASRMVRVPTKTAGLEIKATGLQMKNVVMYLEGETSILSCRFLKLVNEARRVLFLSSP
jgi:hypothetical protein